MMAACGYKTKKELKAAIGKPLNYTETSIFGAEYTPNGQFCLVGPSAYDRRWYAAVVMENGIIKSVK